MTTLKSLSFLTSLPTYLVTCKLYIFLKNHLIVPCKCVANVSNVFCILVPFSPESDSSCLVMAWLGPRMFKLLFNLVSILNVDDPFKDLNNVHECHLAQKQTVHPQGDREIPGKSGRITRRSMRGRVCSQEGPAKGDKHQRSGEGARQHGVHRSPGRGCPAAWSL